MSLVSFSYTTVFCKQVNTGYFLISFSLGNSVQVQSHGSTDRFRRGHGQSASRGREGTSALSNPGRHDARGFLLLAGVPGRHESAPVPRVPEVQRGP